MALFRFDVMVEDKYMCSMAYPYNPLFPIDNDELDEFIIANKPSLAHQHYHIEF